jgi:ribulose-5-phosphate 4-epimerase/fuculose-1-phosphate aldolase
LSCIEGGQLEMCSQNAIRFYGRVAYDDTYNGAAFDDAEGERISSKLVDKDVLLMANHGVLVAGEDVAQAFDDLYYLERAAMIQVLAMNTGRSLRMIPDDVCRMAYEQFGAESAQACHFLAAIKRILTRECPEFMD